MIYVLGVFIIILLAVLAFMLQHAFAWIGAVFMWIAIVALLLVYGPQYTVWEKELDGKAIMKRAEWTRQVQVEEAKAKFESAKFLSKAEVERAKGVAEANKIVADGLGGAEGYLRYLYIEGLKETGGTGKVIYIPTEAGLPILEASRLK